MGEARKKILYKLVFILNVFLTVSNTPFFVGGVLGPQLWHMEVPGPGIELELHLRPAPQLVTTLDP